MNAPNDNTAREVSASGGEIPRDPACSASSTRGSTATSASSGPRALSAASSRSSAGIICLAYGVWGWAAFFLVIAALNFGGGAWYLSIVRSTTARA